MLSHYFRPVVKVGAKPGKLSCYSKVTAVVLLAHFRVTVIVIFRRINCNEE